MSDHEGLVSKRKRKKGRKICWWIKAGKEKGKNIEAWLLKTWKKEKKERDIVIRYSCCFCCWMLQQVQRRCFRPARSSVTVTTAEYQLGSNSLPVCSYLVSDNDVAANNSIAATSFLHLPATVTAAPSTDQLRSPSSFHPFFDIKTALPAILAFI